jgi:AcrR family transcriptional regulator
VTDAALAIADRDGFGAVTMRAIAAEVGATAMALYAYFSNKNALYAGMRERIFFVHVGAEKISRRTWQSMLEGLARGLYQVMHQRPNWTPVFAYHSGPASAGLGFIDESVRLMREDAPCVRIVAASAERTSRGEQTGKDDGVHGGLSSPAGRADVGPEGDLRQRAVAGGRHHAAYVVAMAA